MGNRRAALRDVRKSARREKKRGKEEGSETELHQPASSTFSRCLLLYRERGSGGYRQV